MTTEHDYQDCKKCQTRYVPRDEGPLSRGYCGDSCEYEATHPEYENESRGEA